MVDADGSSVLLGYPFVVATATATATATVEIIAPRHTIHLKEAAEEPQPS